MSLRNTKFLLTTTLLAIVQLLPPGSSFTQGAAKPGAIEVLTPVEGSDFTPFLRSVYISIKREWLSALAVGVARGDKGRVLVQFRIKQDGNVPDDTLKVASGSGSKEFDSAAMNAIRNAAPFGHFPAKSSQAFIDLRMSFYYNVDPPKPR